MNIKQEFGKWFLDVAKYVLTAMILTSMIDGLSQTWLIVGASVLMSICLIFGGILISKGRKDEDRRERNRQRHRDKVSKGGK
jgi:Sec-independent protein secretion pathway component TatC